MKITNLRVVNCTVIFSFLSNRKLWLSFSCQNTCFLFHHKIRLLYIRYQTLGRRIHNGSYSLYVLGLENSVKAYLIVWITFVTMTDKYINTLLTCDILSGAIYNIKFTPIKWWNNIALIMWNDTFNAYVESSNIVVTCSREVVITILTYLQ